MVVLPVVLIHYRAPDWCRSAVRAVAASEGIDADVIVVDNSGELADDVDIDATVLSGGGNTGYAGGANRGVRLALARHPGAAFVAVCSHDFHPAPDCFRRILEAGAADRGLGVLAPRLTEPKPDIGSFFDGRRSRRAVPGPDVSPRFEPDWVSGTCMVLRSEVLRSIGGFDEGFGSYMEDVDLCLRARSAGWRVASITAAVGRGLGSVSDERFRLTAVNVALLAAKREGAVAARALALRYALRCARGVVMAALPSTRDLARRRASIRHARVQGAAAWQLLVDRRISVYARDPHHYEPAFGPLVAPA